MVRRAREAKRMLKEGMTVEEVAKRSGVSKRSVYRWVSEKVGGADVD